VLRTFARSKGLIAFDFDGTLAPISEDPFQVWIAPQTRTLLKRVCALYPCMVISGRAREDVRRRLRGTGIGLVVGNHGADLGDCRPYSSIVSGWKSVVAPALMEIPGLWVEDKELSLAIHYRQSPHKAEARRSILRVAKQLAHARIVPARQAVNLIPEDAPHKGIALAEWQARLVCDAALFVGDDVTDEDVFSMDRLPGLVGIRVGLKRTSRAKFWLHKQCEIDDLLRVLIALRERSVSSHSPEPGRTRVAKSRA
jgi:trehalose 6-phosphate phosphatase